MLPLLVEHIDSAGIAQIDALLIVHRKTTRNAKHDAGGKSG
ncbi:hypothetical protein SDC9_125885 [bioreactor metagenome]|uniref:Uncharacterized protein n=1 Tax=bioreactor metagenome TaxID=1076179 RepID=A0A645CP61_9ZZZZ